MKKVFILLIIGMFLIVHGCSVKQSEYNDLASKCDSMQIALLYQDSIIQNQHATIQALRDSINVLSFPAEQRYARILKLVKGLKLDSALFEIRGLKETFPHSQEALASNNQIEHILKKKAELKAEEERRMALGFKVFKDKSAISIMDEKKQLKCSFSGFNYGRTFTYDYCEDVGEYHYRTADKDHVYVLTSMTMSTKEKYAYPPSIYVCKIENGNLIGLTSFTHEYATWTSYGAMIGNYTDYSHDFSKVNSIRYKLAAEISLKDSKQPLVVIAKKDGGYLRDSLSVSEVYENYYILKILNRNKL